MSGGAAPCLLFQFFAATTTTSASFLRRNCELETSSQQRINKGTHGDHEQRPPIAKLIENSRA